LKYNYSSQIISFWNHNPNSFASEAIPFLTVKCLEIKTTLCQDSIILIDLGGCYQGSE